jgi:hypothetical protein
MDNIMRLEAVSEQGALPAARGQFLVVCRFWKSLVTWYECACSRGEYAEVWREQNMRISNGPRGYVGMDEGWLILTCQVFNLSSPRATAQINTYEVLFWKMHQV